MISRSCVALGLGANLGDPLAMFRKAAKILSEDVLEEIKVSRAYRTAPWGILDQPWFLNAVVVGMCEWPPPAIVHYIQDLERTLGRTTGGPRNGPRVLDIDLLVWGNEVWNSPGLQVPHPGLAEREFVLFPLRDVLPSWRHPILGKTVQELCLQLPAGKEPQVLDAEVSAFR